MNTRVMTHVHILAVVENDLQLIFALRRVLESNGYGSFNVARNSQEAILYLRGVGVYHDRHRYPLPSALILDAQNKDAADLVVLGWLREQQRFADLPVIIILCEEKHAAAHMACMLDAGSFLVDRSRLPELIDVLDTFSAPHPITGHRENVSFHRPHR